MADKNFNLQTNISLNTKEFQQGVKDVNSNIGKLVQGIEGTNGSIGEMKKALASLRNISFAGKSVEEINSINKRIGELTDKMGDLKAMQKGLGTEFGTAMAGGLQTIAAAGEVVVGLASAFGASKEQAEKYQKAMVQLIGVTQALGVIEDALATKQFQVIAMKIKDTAVTAAQTRRTWALNTSLMAIMGTIGLVIGALTLITAGIYLLVKSFDAETDALERNNRQLEDRRLKLSKLTYDQQLSLRILRAKGVDEKTLANIELGYAKQRLEKQKAIVDGLKKEVEWLGFWTKAGKEKNAELLKEQEAYDELNGNIMVMNASYDKIITTTNNETKAIQGKIKALKEMISLQSQGSITPSKSSLKNGIIPYTSPDSIFNQVENSTEAHHAYILRITKEFADKQKKIDDEVYQNKITNAEAIAGAMGNMASVFEQNTAAYKIFAIAQIGISTALAAIKALGELGPIAGAIAAAGIIAAGAAATVKVASYEQGGIIGGSSFTGDNIPAFVNSGEMILNRSQQANLFAMANSNTGSYGGQVEFEIKGDRLVGVLDQYSRRTNKIR